MFPCDVSYSTPIVTSPADKRSAIKTYNGKGVSQQIKYHHSKIFTGKKEPGLMESEARGHRNGILERIMQPRAIRVKTDNREQSLDQYSKRLLTSVLPHGTSRQSN